MLFVVVGGEMSYYGWDKLHTGKESFKEWVLGRGDFDPSRFLFFGQIDPAKLARLLNLSDLHFYLTVPFVTSWSLFNALSCGRVVLASDVGPVREVVEPGVTGLIEHPLDADGLTATALKVLDDPAAYRPLARAGRELIENRYSLDVCIPPIKDFLDRMAARRAAVASSARAYPFEHGFVRDIMRAGVLS